MARLWKQIQGSRFARDSTVLQAGSLMLACLGLVGVLCLSHILGASRQGEYYLSMAVFHGLVVRPEPGGFLHGLLQNCHGHGEQGLEGRSRTGWPLPSKQPS